MGKLNKSGISEEVANESIDANQEIAGEVAESAASETLKPNSMPVGPANKSSSIAKVVNAMAGMDKETINKFVATISQIGHEADLIPDGDAAKNKGTLGTKPSGAAVQLVTRLESAEDASVSDIIKEDVSAIFEGEELTEDFKNKVGVLIESVINIQVDRRVVELEEAYEAKYEEEMDELVKELAQTMDDYLEFAVKEWMSMNEVAIASTIRSDLTENFLENLKALFETHYIDVPADKVDVLEEMSSRIDQLEATASENIEEVLALRKQLAEKEAVIAVTEMARGMTDTDAEKLFELASSVDYTNTEDLVSKVTILKETYFKADDTTSASKPAVLFEEVEIIDDEITTKKLAGPMESYVNTLSRTIRKS